MLINNGYWPGVLRQLQEIKAMGAQGVAVQIGFPMLYEPFMVSAGQTYASYVTFYSNVAYAVRQLGMKLIVENDIMLASGAAGAGWNSSTYLASLTWDQYQQARAQTAAVVAQTMSPDYIVLTEEPDTEATNSGQTNARLTVHAP